MKNATEDILCNYGARVEFSVGQNGPEVKLDAKYRGEIIRVMSRDTKSAVSELLKRVESLKHYKFKTTRIKA